MIETRLLRSFLVVAEELHFGRAADRLHLTQPPLTRQIQQLEEELGGIPLFDRSRRRIALTDAGRAMVEEAHGVLDRLDRAVAHTRSIARGEAGRLRIGFISTANYSVLPRLLKSFTGRFPAVRVELHESTEDEQIEGLREGSLDVGVLIPSVRDDSLEGVDLYREPLVAVLPRGHPLGRTRGALAARSIRDETFVLFPRALAPSLHDAILGYARRAGFSPKIGQEARQMQTIIGLVAGGLGVSFVPACMQELRRSDVVYKKLAPAPPEVTTRLVWPRARRSAVLESFVAAARERRRR